MAKDTKGEYKEFRDLLRRGIGTRTQKAFAEELGISKEYLNRMLNNREISRPSAGLLKNMAAHMQTITERMLLESCGYTVEPIEEKIKRCEKGLADGLLNLVNINYIHPWKSVEDAIQSIDVQSIATGKLDLNKEEICTEDGHRCAEKKMSFFYRWDDGEKFCVTSANIYYSRTESGNIIFLDYDMEGTEVMTKEKINGLTAEKRLLKAIFGEDDGKLVVTTTFGYGFYYPETPAGFVDFLCEYRGVFCTGKARSQMFLSVVDDGQDPDIVFSDYDSDKYGSGTGGVVAEILSNELGLCFYHYERSKHLEEEDSPSCVMVEDVEFIRSKKSKKQFLLCLQRAAETLQIPNFGYIYHSDAFSVETKLYDTKSFCYEF